jgi:uncharacterized OB-fold protein
MPQPKAIQPELYSVEPADAPRLKGGRCRACGYVFFPPQSYGCESCGAPPDQLEPVELAGRGTLHSFATVHLHQGKGIEAPFTVGVIVLDDGPALRAILTDRTDAALAIGNRMRAKLVAQGRDDSGAELVELRFERAEAKA